MPNSPATVRIWELRGNNNICDHTILHCFHPGQTEIIIYMNTHCKQISNVNKIVYNQKNFTIMHNGVIAKNEGGGVNFSPGESINLESRNPLETAMLGINSQIRVRKVSPGGIVNAG